MRTGILLAAAFGPCVASAQGAVEAARSAYEAGAAAFRARRFDEALRHFEQAYRLDPSPILVYNQARAHEELGNAPQAIALFRLYLERTPDATDRADVERRVRVMQAIVARMRPPEAPRDEAPPPAVEAAQPTDDPSLRPFAYAALGLGAAGLAAGAWFAIELGAAEDDFAAAVRERRTRDALDDEDRAERSATLANVAFVAGGALLAGGVALWLLDGDDAGAAVAPTPGGAAFAWTGRF